MSTGQTIGDLVKLTKVENSYPFWSPDGSKIVFQSNRSGGNSDIYIMDSDGTNAKRITNSLGDDLTPVWSPDGQKIVFQSMRDGNEELYIMELDGSNQRNITYSKDAEMHPKWHPNSDKIIFSAQKGYWNVVDHWQINIDGTDLKRVTRDVSIDTYVSWSPNTKQILGRKIIGVNSEIFLFDSEGNHGKNLTNDPAFDGWPSWHPNGKEIVYASENDSGDSQIYTLNLENSNRTKLISEEGSWTKPIWNQSGTKLICTREINGSVDIFSYEPRKTKNRFSKLSKISNAHPSLSPDNKKIVFHSNRFGENDIFIMNSDGSGLERLTDSPGNDRTPYWSPDGSKICFVSTRGWNYDVFVMNSDGSNQKNLTMKSDSKEVHPYWSEDGEKIIFNSSRENDTYGIYTINFDGSGLNRIEENGGGDNTHAKYSPDGQKIVFRKLIEKENWNSEIFLMDRDGKNEMRLTNSILFSESPTWSPDGTEILFSIRNDKNNNTHLYTISMDGSSLNCITPEEDGVHYLSPSYSSDGMTIVCSRTKDGNEDIVTFKLLRTTE